MIKLDKNSSFFFSYFENFENIFINEKKKRKGKNFVLPQMLIARQKENEIEEDAGCFLQRSMLLRGNLETDDL